MKRDASGTGYHKDTVNILETLQQPNDLTWSVVSKGKKAVERHGWILPVPELRNEQMNGNDAKRLNSIPPPAHTLAKTCVAKMLSIVPNQAAWPDTGWSQLAVRLPNCSVLRRRTLSPRQPVYKFLRKYLI
jgi:hypothetical protein